MIDYEQKRKDEQLGAIGEIKTFDFLGKNNKNIRKYLDRYAIKDYYLVDKEGKTIHEYELKTRRVKHNTYPSVVFGLNKYNHSLKQLKKNIRQTYLFRCEDGLYGWELKDVEEQKDEYYFGNISNRARNDKEHPAVFIKSQYLKLLS